MSSGAEESQHLLVLQFSTLLLGSNHCMHPDAAGAVSRSAPDGGCCRLCSTLTAPSKPSSSRPESKQSLRVVHRMRWPRVGGLSSCVSATDRRDSSYKATLVSPRVGRKKKMGCLGGLLRPWSKSKQTRFVSHKDQHKMAQASRSG